MKRSATIRTTLTRLAFENAAHSGLESVSVRGIAREAGCSTAAIFQNFEGKADLVVEAATLAARQDAEWHQILLAEVDGLIANHLGFSDFLSAYVDMREVQPQARVLSELLIRPGDDARCHALLRDCYQARIAFWEAILAPFGFAARFGAIVAEFVMMEEIYVYSLRNEPRYQLLMREAVRSLCGACFHQGAAAELTNEVNRQLQGNAYEARRRSEQGRSEMPGELLRHAVEIIRSEGIAALNQRTLARQASVSPSMIAYHFKDMKTFKNEAIWQALVEDLPSEFDPASMVSLPRTLPEWVEFLDATLVAPPGSSVGGFYVSYSRMTCETSLLARSDRSLVPLVTYLREIDGWGTYRLSRNIASLAGGVQREHAAAFAVWLKAEALLRQAGVVCAADGRERITHAMALIFPAAQVPPAQVPPTG
ncbi:TetR/AcrR family transcriptional regulator [Novosphingobium colocasiae]|uniref:TetR/AcrR family transcriptional regulator n=1 Tax=Novosphingobium colocasiae TaxID=1256513 RepID=UPI0035B01F2F